MQNCFFLHEIVTVFFQCVEKGVGWILFPHFAGVKTVCWRARVCRLDS